MAVPCCHGIPVFRQMSCWSRMSRRFFLLITLVLLSVTHGAGAQTASFCGTVDFRRASSNDLFNLVMFEDLAKHRTRHGVECGLPFEKLDICSSCNNDFPESSLRELRPVLGQKSHVDWHAKWHKIRIGAESIDETLFKKLQDAELVPKDLARDDFFKTYGIKGKLAGENFFYMHRLMLKMLQFELSMRGLPCVAPWTALPESVDDAVWPAPGGDRELLDALKIQLAHYQDSAYLAGVSLNQLGGILEPTLHIALHNFYKGQQRCTAEAVAQGYCDDLVPVETSPLNKYFWKIHGLVDGILGKWLVAHGKNEISENCGGRAACYEWQGVWVGKYPRL
jgi:hypothetical protein